MILETTPEALRTKKNWLTIVIMVIFHAGALAALAFFDWRAVAVTLGIHWLAVYVGIGMGYHRLHTHRSYKVPKWLDYFLATCGALSLQGGPIFWVATHRIHHQKSDQPGDPHSPRDGAAWAHVGWTLVGERGHDNTAAMARYAPDLAADPFYVRLNDSHWVPTLLLSVVLYVWGGLPFLLWGTFFRVVMGWHITWLVNSATHMWGAKRFPTRDDSRNNWWVALLTFGEGWHNNHHAHPTSARHGLAWYELDITWLQIRFLQWIGLAKAVKVAKTNVAVLARRAA